MQGKKSYHIHFMELHCFFVIFLLFLFTGFSCLAMGESPKRRVVGGQCDYNKYKGHATIISIKKKDPEEKNRGPSYERYEVKFTFHTNETIKEKHGQVEGKEYLMLLENFQHPGPKFLNKYGIQEGETFNCYLNVIIRGSCTPIIFDFPTIDLGDYRVDQKSAK